MKNKNQTKKRRILLLNYEFPPIGGGAANATYHLLHEFAKDTDITIDVVTSSFDSYKEEFFPKKKKETNIRIFYLDIGKKGKNMHYQSTKDLLLYSWKAYFFSKKLIGKNTYDIIHAFFGIPCGYIAMKIGLPYIVSLRGSDVPFYSKRFYMLDKLIFQRLSKNIWTKAQHVIANSEGLKKLALQTNPNQKIDVIPNGIDTQRFFPKKVKKSNTAFTVLYVGRLIPRKGVDILLKGFADFYKQNPSARLIIAGDGPMKNELLKKTKEYHIQKIVDFLGRVKHEKLPEIYQKSDVFILPSENEGMSNTILEAMASGLPIITTNTGGSAELVDDNGIIIEKKNPDDIFRVLTDLYKNTKKRKDHGLKSFQKAQKMCWSDIARKYDILYKEIS